MTEFITKDNKVIPINNSKNLSSKDLGLGNESLSSKNEKVESLMSVKQGGFPPTTAKVGIQKGWKLEDYQKARLMMIDIIQKETGKTLDENGRYTQTELINGSEVSTYFQLIPSGKRSSQYSGASIVYTGFKVVLPKDSASTFEDRDEFEEKSELKVKDEGGLNGVELISVPASNPTKINQIVPFLNDLVTKSLEKKALQKVEEAERKIAHEESKIELQKIHAEGVARLAKLGFKSPSYRPEDYEYNGTIRRTYLVGNEDSKDRRTLDIETSVKDGKPIYYIKTGLQNISEEKLVKIIELLKEES